MRTVKRQGKDKKGKRKANLIKAQKSHVNKEGRRLAESEEARTPHAAGAAEGACAKTPQV